LDGEVSQSHLHCRDVESHSRPRENILVGHSGKFFGILFFKIAHFGVLYILSDGRALKRRGAWGKLPLPPLDSLYTCLMFCGWKDNP